MFSSFLVLSLMFYLIYYDQFGKTGFETHELKIVGTSENFFVI